VSNCAASIVVDRGYAKLCRTWRAELVQRLPAMRVVQVETNVVVPVELASRSREPAAATLRPKIQRLLPRFLVPLREVALEHPASADQLTAQAPLPALEDLDIDRSVPRAPSSGGSRLAEERFQAFLPKLARYGVGKGNDPSVQDNSFLSPYLHFGHISSLDLALRVSKAQGPTPSRSGADASKVGPEAFLEELIIRRELAKNFCLYCDDYNLFDCLPGSARHSLLQHATDPRPVMYSFERLQRGETDDPCWNAAQWEMVSTGHMHNYMRMYWCKQLIVWTPDPRTAYEWAVRLNDRFSLDGRDENGYMGIAWCFGHHDRPFPERAIFGEVRPMTRKGLESKFDMQRYQQLVWRKCRAASAAEPRLLALLPAAALGGGQSGGLGALFRGQKQGGAL
ncbi:unnamed protein product, partial [Polarella glacialis]